MPRQVPEPARLYVLTRSAYSADVWDKAAARRRLRMTAGVTVPCMAAQVERRWEWVVLMDETDPLGPQRQRVYEQAGVPVHFLTTRGGELSRAQAAMAAYRHPGWLEATSPRDRPTVMLRLDDDDALHPTTLARLWAAAQQHKTGRSRQAFMFPVGFRVYGQLYSSVRHESNAMAALLVPRGDTGTVYDYLHRRVHQHVPVQVVDSRPAWLWVRHPDTLSGWKVAQRPVDARLRKMFPVDWQLLAQLPGGPPSPKGRAFR
jgi:hypothetical protein